jgi:hypothetical protein
MRSLLHFRYYPSTSLEGLRKTAKNISHVADLGAEAVGQAEYEKSSTSSIGKFGISSTSWAAAINSGWFHNFTQKYAEQTACALSKESLRIAGQQQPLQTRQALHCTARTYCDTGRRQPNDGAQMAGATQ